MPSVLRIGGRATRICDVEDIDDDSAYAGVCGRYRGCLSVAADQMNGKEPCFVTMVKHLVSWIKTDDKSKPEPVNETPVHVPFLSTDCLEDLPAVCIGHDDTMPLMDVLRST